MSPESRIVGKRNDLLTPTAEAKNILNERTWYSEFLTKQNVSFGLPENITQIAKIAHEKGHL
jgi:hypothetical protein